MGGVNMKKSIAAIGLLILLVPFSVASAQSEDANYLKFDYIKVQPANVSLYIDYMSSTWKPLYQKRVEAGTIDSWALYRVFFPGGARGDYNFVAITSAAGMNTFETLRPRDLLELEKKNGNQVNQMMARANNLRTIMYSELWKAINKVAVEESPPHPAKYVNMDYMHVTPGKDYDYQMLEDEFAKPIHEERIQLDNMQGWELYQLLTPGGTEYGATASSMGEAGGSSRGRE